MRDSEDSSSHRKPRRNPHRNPLWDAYRTTTYESHAGPRKIAIRIGEPNPLLDALLREHARNTWCYITAWNPASELLEHAENEARNQRLRDRLVADGYTIFSGQGRSADPTHAPEASFLALGVERGRAIALGRAYGQNAVVCGVRGGRAELVDCRIASRAG